MATPHFIPNLVIIPQPEQIDKYCLTCGKHYTVSPFNIKQDWCSSDCFVTYKETYKDKPSNNIFMYIITSHGETLWYGSNWSSQRRKVHKRDLGVCQHCGATRKDDEAHIEVHHIQKFKSFNGDWLSANQLHNLITLCRSCHIKAERGDFMLQVKLL